MNILELRNLLSTAADAGDGDLNSPLKLGDEALVLVKIPYGYVTVKGYQVRHGIVVLETEEL